MLSPEAVQTVMLEGVSFRVEAQGFEKFWKKAALGRWEPSTLRILATCIQPGDIYLDVGAWIGPTALLAARYADQVYAFEPDPVAFQQLQRNFALNPDLNDRATLVSACLWTRDGQVELSNSGEFGDSTSSLVLQSDLSRMPVAAMTLETALRRVVGRRVTFIKLDVEGGEYYLIPAWSKYLRRSRPSLFVSMHSAYLLEYAKHWRPWMRLKYAWLGFKLYRSTAHYRYRYVMTWHTIREGSRFRTLAAIIHSDKSVLFTDQPLSGEKIT